AGTRRGVDWLEHAPPARRELLVAGPLTIGSLSTADLAIVPRDVGISFERTSTMPAQRTVEYASVWSATGKVDRHVTLAGAATSVRDVPAGDRTSLADHMPLDVVANEPARRYVDAAIVAVLSQRVWTVPPARRARLGVAGARGTPTWRLLLRRAIRWRHGWPRRSRGWRATPTCSMRRRE